MIWISVGVLWVIVAYLWGVHIGYSLKPNTILIKALQKIRQEIAGNMESIIGKYDASTPEHNRPSHKIERNNGRKECIEIIDKHIKEIERSDEE